MAKHYKTDYFEKLIQLASICCDNVSIAQRIISSEHSAFEKNAVTGKNIMQEIKLSLEKDFFAPFEREDIFIVGTKLNELSESTKILSIILKQTDVFSITSDSEALVECLKNITENVLNIVIQLSKYPKQGDMTDYFNKTEILIYNFRKKFFGCFDKDKKSLFNALLQIIKECADKCKEINTLIQYTLIKNS